MSSLPGAEPEPRRRIIDAETRIIEPRAPGAISRVRELWVHRRLILFFGRRYIEKSYQRTWLGLAWVPLRPILDVGIRVLLFGSLLAVPSEGKPYLLFFIIGTTAWHLFDRTAYWATRSLELNRRLLTRMYVPRLAALVAAVAPTLLSTALYAVISLIIALWFTVVDGFPLDLGLHTLGVPLGGALAALLGLSIGLWTSVPGARARDVRFTLSYVLNFWYFVTPVIYPLSGVPSAWRRVAELNPMTAPVELVKSGLLGTPAAPSISLWVTLGTIAVVGGTGLVFFARAEAAALDSL